MLARIGIGELWSRARLKEEEEEKFVGGKFGNTYAREDNRQWFVLTATIMLLSLLVL